MKYAVALFYREKLVQALLYHINNNIIWLLTISLTEKDLLFKNPKFLNKY